MVNIKRKPIDHEIVGLFFFCPLIVISQLKILIPVGIAIIIVVSMKYDWVLMSIPIVNIWCLHTINPINLIVIIAKIIFNFLKFLILFVS